MDYDTIYETIVAIMANDLYTREAMYELEKELGNEFSETEQEKIIDAALRLNPSNHDKAETFARMLINPNRMDVDSIRVWVLL